MADSLGSLDIRALNAPTRRPAGDLSVFYTHLRGYDWRPNSDSRRVDGDQEGRVIDPFVSPGVWTIQLRALGFAPDSTEVTIRPHETTRVTVRLQPGRGIE